MKKMSDEQKQFFTESRQSTQRLFSTLIVAERNGIFDGVDAGDVQASRSFYITWKSLQTNEEVFTVFVALSILFFSVSGDSVTEDKLIKAFVLLGFFIVFVGIKTMLQFERSPTAYLMSMIGKIDNSELKNPSDFYLSVLREKIFGKVGEKGILWKKLAIATAIFVAIDLAFFMNQQSDIRIFLVMFVASVNFLDFYKG